MSFIRRHALTAFALAAFAYLMLPIAVVVLFSFNDPAGRFNYTWEGFTLKHWGDPFGAPGLKDAIVTSLEIAALASLVATVLGTLIALALVRYGFRGRGLTNLLIFMPMTTPEVVMGASLLTLFLNLGVDRFHRHFRIQRRRARTRHTADGPLNLRRPSDQPARAGWAGLALGPNRSV